MTSFAQNREDILISEYFGNYNGTLLDIGSNDGLTFSNSRLLILKGWSACLVEPSDWAFNELVDLYDKTTYASRVSLLNYAIGQTSGVHRFYESDTLLNKQDKALVSTLHQSEIDRWEGKVKFKETEISVITFEELLTYMPLQPIDFISIDCEGEDLAILKQIDLDRIGCKCVCVEFNGVNEQAYWDVMRLFEFKLLHKNGENLIYVR
jgi:FkbM family methyltransferase